MKKVSFRLPEFIAAKIEAEARKHGSVDGLPVDLSARKKHYPRTGDYGRKRLS